MKKDLDRLMSDRKIDLIWITGPAGHNPSMYYMTGGGNITRADLVIMRGESPILFYQPMERDEAGKSDLLTRSLDDFNLHELIRKANGDVNKSRVLLYQAILKDLGIDSGQMLVYGKIDAGQAYAVFRGLQEVMPDLKIVSEGTDNLLSEAMLTKDEREISQIKSIGEITTQVVSRVAEFLSGQRSKDSILVDENGEPITIGSVKSKINLWLAELGAENPEATIFSIGRDAGVPHSTGNAEDVLALGKPIIFDIFPCQIGGGYFYDLTRTWCLGYAPDEVYQLYEDVRSVFTHVMGQFELGSKCTDYQKMVCKLFEERGHPTINSNPKTLEGYVHSLGHGVGLNIHERPWFGESAAATDLIQPGVVFTVEPGLYYPDIGMGVRLEDTVWVNRQGEIEILAEYPYDLVLPVK